ncbi:MAG: hypothetical protein AMXMBFR46_21800 [Acidimicrobiia bacterium]
MVTSPVNERHAAATLAGYLDGYRPYERARRDLEPLWLAAANERLAQHRECIPVLGRLADERGIDEIRSLEDLVPLLFAHSNYKSYPESFVAKGRWDLMSRWLDTLSAVRVEGVDVAGVENQDEWIERLHAAGHMVFATSGTSGKNSFLPATPSDREFSMRALLPIITWVHGVEPRSDRAVFILSPKYAPNRVSHYFREVAEAFGRPDARFFLTEEPLRVSDISRMAALHKEIAAGTAKPSDIAAFERETRERQDEMAQRLDHLVDELLEHRHEPMIIGGFWSQYWMIVERARARGISAGEFHPDTVITGGGGTKGATLPDDYERQILDFFGLTHANVQSGYGMSELSAGCPAVDGRYRPMPWVIPLVLDDTGEHLLNADDGLVEGRFAFFDVSLEGRWGGLITGDHVVADFSTPNVSVVEGSVARYSELEGGDDKLTCAGTVDAYVRGVMA